MDILFNLKKFIRTSIDKNTTSANCLTFDKSGVVLAVGYDNGDLRVLNVKNIQNTDISCPGNEDAVLDVIFDSENKALVTCGADKTFRIFL
jgi:WD40 repeat protein